MKETTLPSSIARQPSHHHSNARHHKAHPGARQRHGHTAMYRVSFSQPTQHYHCCLSDFASRPEARRRLLTHQAVTIDATSEADLAKHIAAHDVAVSLIPYIYHAAVIKPAIRSGTNMVTTSYVSDAIRALDEDAKKAGITVLNEVGVDPGVDHLYAIKKINEVHTKGGRVLEFYSYCGGLPAPERTEPPLVSNFRGLLAVLYSHNGTLRAS
ncbi:hypothetical protein BU23DRAFT_597610 [Bimuria novae-zelandiae CBS 107.79]|uniref:Saccharopine dehydrogenase n=1 Tax=Bimuria novae-zelandiae CBS 107.79 TaxID=1447943 RepID=A0A6A5VFB8_9PLEO|nr:hypothetical protein BU23DRAFT_597610 [Bimuria novae-zelandiae CBS 107.79]